MYSLPVRLSTKTISRTILMPENVKSRPKFEVRSLWMIEELERKQIQWRPTVKHIKSSTVDNGWRFFLNVVETFWIWREIFIFSIYWIGFCGTKEKMTNLYKIMNRITQAWRNHTKCTWIVCQMYWIPMRHQVIPHQRICKELFPSTFAHIFRMWKKDVIGRTTITYFSFL